MPSKVINIFLLVVSFFVFLIGMVGLNFYNESKTESRVSRLNYTSFIGYVLGLGTILFYVGTMNSMGLTAGFITGFLSLVTLLVWTMCAMMISDMKKENKDKGFAYKFTAGMLGINLILWLWFSALTFTPLGRLSTATADGIAVGMSVSNPIMGARFGGNLNSPLYGFGRRHY
jgi:hypothetical protein